MDNLKYMIPQLGQSYTILESLKRPHGLYVASSFLKYLYVWLRDNVFKLHTHINKSCDTFEKGIHRIFDLFLEYEAKIDHHTRHRPLEWYEFIHAKFTPEEVRETREEWGHNQPDSIGGFLWLVGEGFKVGRNVLRNEADRRMLQKLVWYLECIEYWHCPNYGVWEEGPRVLASTIGACIAGLRNVRDMVYVNKELITKGKLALDALYLRESPDRFIDLAQILLVWPFKTYSEKESRIVLDRIESNLLRSRGVIRYQSDSYYNTDYLHGDGSRSKSLDHYKGKEAEWVFGIFYLSLAWLELGNVEKAKAYLNWGERLILPNGHIPEAYYAGTNIPNDNTPLGWSHAIHIQAVESLHRFQD